MILPSKESENEQLQTHKNSQESTESGEGRAPGQVVVNMLSRGQRKVGESELIRGKDTELGKLGRYNFQ